MMFHYNISQVIKTIKNLGWTILWGYLLLCSVHMAWASAIEQHHVQKVECSAPTLIMDDHTQVHLASIIVPKFMKQQACDVITSDAQGKTVFLNDSYVDRQNRIFAHVSEEASQSVQADLLAKGLAYHYLLGEVSESVSEELIQAEKEVRRNQKGIWKLDVFKRWDADALVEQADLYEGKFVFVEGVVRDMAEKQGKFYLNFGDDPKTDFTVMIEKDRLTEVQRQEILSYLGQKLLVRGWLETYNGPYMQVYHASHMRVL